MSKFYTSPFNSALETGIRALTILVASYPRSHDLSRLVQYDYLLVHSGDADGPPSLHPPLPLRAGELLVRRGLVEAGVRLLLSRNLASRILGEAGFQFRAEEAAGAFVDNLTSPYLHELRSRAEWVAKNFDPINDEELNFLVKRFFAAWTTEFQASDNGTQEGLL